MKTFIIFILLIFSGNHLLAQNKCNDEVHPTDNRISILKCCIKDLKAGNIVVYKKDRIVSEIEAQAISLNGEFIYLDDYSDSVRSLVLINREPEGHYKGFNYDYYQKLHRKASAVMVGGIFLTTVGVGMIVGGFLYQSEANPSNLSESLDQSMDGVGLFFGGFVASGVGIPLMISGSIKTRKNKKAMREIEQNDKLSIRISPNGVGLVYNF